MAIRNLRYQGDEILKKKDEFFDLLEKLGTLK